MLQAEMHQHQERKWSGMTVQSASREERVESFVQALWTVHEGGEPLCAVAVHAGHDLREELARLIAIDEATRLREEDPYTDYLAAVAPTRLVPHRSRFEVDLNRARDEAVYLGPEDAWGLPVWKTSLPEAEIQCSLAEYDAYYAELERLLDKLELRYGRFVIFDIHSYNHRRAGPHAPPADPAHNPDVNVGTGSMDRQRWAPLVDRFIADLRRFDYLGRHLDVRENVKFKGRHFARWVHAHYPQSACVLSLEFKKIFMDEWTGAVDPDRLEALYEALKSTLPGIAEEMARL